MKEKLETKQDVVSLQATTTTTTACIYPEKTNAQRNSRLYDAKKVPKPSKTSLPS
jgi:hypothetical protein